jgi:hypothetical protein
MSSGFVRAIVVVSFSLAAMVRTSLGQVNQYDVVIYGGTSGGIAAAVQAARMGKTVAVIEPGNRIGGMTTNGLSFTDLGNTNAIQGLAREFYLDVGERYGLTAPNFNFEPKVALAVFDEWVATPGITLFKNERLDRSAGGVVKSGSEIQSIRMESGLSFGGSMFIDAGYEGDLMASAGVSYATGRESNSTYGERYNGVQRGAPGGHNFATATPVDPYVIAGNPSSGLLPGIDPNPLPANGTGDYRVQSYNFRLTLTQAANRRAWTAPANYDQARYELLRRYVVANNITTVRGRLLKLDALRGGKFDLNNQGAVSTDFIGQNYAYPNADYATREQIVAAHKEWQQGLLYFLATDPSLPASIRTEMNSYGLTADEFTDTDGWSEQIYVREARRMIGRFVMSDNNIIGNQRPTDSVGLGSYTMDSHHVQRFVDANGKVFNEGDVQVGVPSPYRISYRSLTPQEEQASNLLVTSAVSASHIAYGSIRMEPVFMTLGQAAGTAAALSIDNNTSVQDLSYQMLRAELIGDGALLEWPANLPASGKLTSKADFNDLVSHPINMRFSPTGSGFVGTWDGTGTENVVAGDLAYSKGGYAVLQSGDRPGKVQGNYNEPRQNTRGLAGSLDGEIWMSVLLSNPDATARAGISLNPATNADPVQGPVEQLILLNGTSLSFALRGVTLTTASDVLALGQTHLILAKLNVISGMDTLSIWGDPEDLLNLGAPDLIVSDRDLMESFSFVGLLSYNTAGPAFSANGGYIDALRISNAEDGFFQVTGVPEPGSCAVILLGFALMRRRRINL